MMNKKKLKILIAVIAFNEEKNIVTAIGDLRKNFPQGDIVVFDNSSRDSTVAVCKQMGVSVVSNCINTGSGWGTVKSYMLYGFQHGYDIVCQFDGDAQHMASYLPQLIEPIQNDEADMVIGSRFIEKEGFQSLFLRRIGIRLFSYLDSKIVKHPITDSTSGFRSYNKKVIQFFAKNYKHELFDTNQLIILSSFAGARIVEVPVQMKPRIHGESEFNFSKTLSFVFGGLVNIVGCFLLRDEIKNLIRV